MLLVASVFQLIKIDLRWQDLFGVSQKMTELNAECRHHRSLEPEPIRSCLSEFWDESRRIRAFTLNFQGKKLQWLPQSQLVQGYPSRCLGILKNHQVFMSIDLDSHSDEDGSK